MTHAVYAGTFDPITNGHIWIVERAARMFDKLTIAIGVNPDKKHTFGLEDRLAMIHEVVDGMNNVEVAHYGNLALVNYAKKIGATTIVRGIRNEQDYTYERGMRYVNSDLAPSIDTVFLMPPRQYAEVSSSFVKGLVGIDDWEVIVRPYVPEIVMSRFVSMQAEKTTRTKGDIFDDVQTLVVPMLNGPDRFYHNMTHVRELLASMHRFGHMISNGNMFAFEMAIWFHDAIYDPTRKDNEKLSADMADGFLSRHGIMGHKIDLVRSLIMATTHDHVPESADGKLMADIDILPLACQWDQFQEIGRKVRREYSHVSDKDFINGRAAFFRGMLAKPAVFHLLKQYEPVVRGNLEKALALLDQGVL